MRVSRMSQLLDLKRLNRLKKDFNTPYKALVASSGITKKKFKLISRDNTSMYVDRSDLPVWEEYFSEKNCSINIKNGLFHVIPKNLKCPEYYILGCSETMTYQPRRWYKGNTPKIINELQEAEWSRYSQHGEDGIIDKILSIAGVKHNYLIEFGAHDGIKMSNSRYLITEKNWHALLIEAAPKFFRKLNELYKNDNNVILNNSFVTVDNINKMFADAGAPKDFDVLSIDVDGPDYYLWEALTDFTPRIVIVEYNSSKLPTDDYVVSEDKIFELGATCDEGASLLAFYNLGKRKGYQAIYTELYGSNMFLIHSSIVDKFNIEGIEPSTLYQPPQFGELGGTAALSGRGYK